MNNMVTDMIATVIDNQARGESRKKKKKKKKSKAQSLGDQPLSELMMLLDKNQNYLKLSQEGFC